MRINKHVGRGEGEGEDESFPTDARARLDPSESPSFAPRGPSTAYIKFRRKLPRPLKLEIPPSRSTVARFHDACSVSAFLSLALIS